MTKTFYIKYFAGVNLHVAHVFRCLEDPGKFDFPLTLRLIIEHFRRFRPIITVFFKDF